jgi:DNA-binding response OmpR family regulator
MKRILVVEDDITLSTGIKLALREEQTTFVQAYDLAQARALLAAEAYHLVILDLHLPDGNGLELLSEIRATGTTPIIVLTANDLETDIVTGLELGADDYITKPFSLMVLRARVGVQLKKGQAHCPESIHLGPFSFSFERMEFMRDGKPVELSKNEQKLLRLLVENRGRTLTRVELTDRIWTDGAEYVDENALSVVIKRLRDKLEEFPSRPVYIKTVYGIGYIWAVK